MNIFTKFNTEVIKKEMVPGLYVLCASTLMYFLGWVFVPFVNSPFVRICVLSILTFIMTLLALEIDTDPTDVLNPSNVEKNKNNYMWAAINTIWFLILYVGIPLVFSGSLVRLLSSFGPTKVLIPGVISFLGLWASTALIINFKNTQIV